jgi:hypothetical protein
VTAYQNWAAGRCPCCQADIGWYDDLHPREVIAEGVEICGRCAENDHLGPGAPGLREAMLKAIATRSDQPIENLFNCEPA